MKKYKISEKEEAFANVQLERINGIEAALASLGKTLQNEKTRLWDFLYMICPEAEELRKSEGRTEAMYESKTGELIVFDSKYERISHELEGPKTEEK